MTLHKFIASALLTLAIIGGSVYTLASLAGGIEDQQQNQRQLVASQPKC